MMIDKELNYPKQRIEEFCRNNQVKRLAFFGSFLRNDFSSESDIDILVVFEPSAQGSFLTLGRMKRELAAILNRPIDLVPQDGLKPAIRDSVLASAREIYTS